jgi:biopolymer transport protein ExbB
MGGPVMHALAGLAALALLVILYNMLTVRRRHYLPKRLLRDLDDLIGVGRLEEANELVVNRRSLLAHVVAAGLERRSALKGDPALTRAECLESVRRAMEVTGRRESIRARQRVALLAHIGGIAPLLGLAGTVVAMIQFFYGAGATAGDFLTSQSIMAALISTGTGLLLAVIVFAAYAWLRGRLGATLADIELACERLADRLARWMPGSGKPQGDALAFSFGKTGHRHQQQQERQTPPQTAESRTETSETLSVQAPQTAQPDEPDAEDQA